MVAELLLGAPIQGTTKEVPDLCHLCGCPAIGTTEILQNLVDQRTE